MATSRLLMIVRRAAYFAQDFGRYWAIRDFGAHHQCRAFNKKSIVDEIDNAGNAPKQEQRRKTEPVPKITLLSLDNSMSVTDLESAQRLAKRRNLTLVKVSNLDNKTQRAVYKLASNSIFLKDIEENIANTHKKEQKYNHIKLFYISARITTHDLLIKTKNLIKLLEKGHKVKIVITLDDIKENTVQSAVENAVKNYGSVKKMQSKKNTVLLLITPLSKSNDNSVDNKQEASASNDESK